MNFAYDDPNYDIDPTSLFEEDGHVRDLPVFQRLHFQEQSPSPKKRPSEAFDGPVPRKKHFSGTTDEEGTEREQSTEEFYEEPDEPVEKCDEQVEMEEDEDNSRATTPADERMEVTDPEADDDIESLDSS